MSRFPTEAKTVHYNYLTQNDYIIHIITNNTNVQVIYNTPSDKRDININNIEPESLFIALLIQIQFHLNG